MEVREDHIQEMKALIESGDLDLAERRRAFKTKQGRETTLDDAGMIRACAATDDDDDDLFVSNVLAIEAGE